MFNKDNFIEATFIDTERKNIEVLTKSDDGIITPTIIPFNEENQIFKELMKVTTLDKMHEDTHNKKKVEGEAFKQIALKFAKESGLIATLAVEENREDYFSSILDGITKKQTDEDHLFAFKISAFENLKKIKESDDVEGKKKIRQAKNKIELFRAIFNMIE